MEPLRIGVDLGGTKIEVAGARTGRRGTVPQADGDAAGLRRDARRRSPRWSLPRSTRSAARGTVGVGAPGSQSPATGLWRNANLQFCNGRDLPADICSDTRPAGARRERRQLLRAFGGDRRRRRRRLDGLRRHRRNGTRRRHGGRAQAEPRAERGGRGSLPRAASVAEAGRLSAAALLVRHGRVRGALHFRNRSRARLFAPRRAKRSPPKRSLRAPRRARLGPPPRSSGCSIASPASCRSSSTWSTRM